MKFQLPSLKGKGKAKKGDVKERFKIASLDKKKARAGWIFVLPFILGFLLIYIPIIWQSIQYSFSKINYISGGGYVAENVMFENYENALKDSQFVSTLLNGLKSLALEIPAILFFSLFVAILLNQKMVGRAAFRAIFFIPVILATGLISGIDAETGQVAQNANSITTGSTSSPSIVSTEDIEGLFSNMVVGSDLVTYVTEFVKNIFDIVNRSGVQMLIFLAGLQSISPSVYESCEMEGASAWETFWKITLPMISPMILVNFVYTLIDSFTAESNQVMQYITSVYNSAGRGPVTSSAMSWFYFLVVIGIVAVLGGIIGRLVFYQRRD